ncbi:hypothetical protein CV102_20370 [Natronococcus pandeyae]|uniref:Domain of unknown function domain-containing protein n=1 Tax=Natronococcus pandeyae TaxID=2055836 RepID=A0A8J8PXX0_9EURY|nr:hypothetical protein [Natronococcus pandeyae]TYL36866.1 hypothetical protein CV102_20370 [Natronococcus pandeyae]
MTRGDRDRGLLSQADRAYLRGEADLASLQSERNARARIRNRIYHAMLDFELLVEHLADHDRELVFEKRFGNMNGTDAFDAMVSAAAFLYLATEDTDLEFESVLAEGINVAEAKRDRAATVDLDVTFQSLTVGQLRHKLEQGETLSLTELAYLHQSDEVNMSDLAVYLSDPEDSEQIDNGRIQSKVTNF